MENEVVPVKEEVQKTLSFKTYRPGSLCALAQTIINKLEGEFNAKDIHNLYSEECLKLGEDPKTGIRNIRLVVYAMIGDGRLERVGRGRWKRTSLGR